MTGRTHWTATLFIALIFAMPAQAQEPKYVSDELVIMMRSGAGNEFKILRALKSGTRLEILETSEDQKYALVRNEGGLEGWVLTQYLVNQPPARLRLEEAQARATRLQGENTRLRQELDSLKQESTSTEKERNRLDSAQQKLQDELQKLRQVAARPIELDAENRELKDEMIRVKNQLRLAEEKNHSLQDSADRQWFAVGAAVLLLGLFIGLIIPKIRWRKRSMWGEL